MSKRRSKSRLKKSKEKLSSKEGKRESESSQSSFQIESQPETVDVKRYAPRPPPATQGTPYEIYANFFRIESRFDGNATSYEVKVTQIDSSKSKEKMTEKEAREVNRRVNRIVVFTFLQADSNNIFSNVCTVYDGQNTLYSNYPITAIDDLGEDDYTETITADVDGEKSKYEVRIRHKQSIGLAGLDHMRPCPVSTIRIIDSILRYSDSLSKINFGYKIFYPRSDKWPRKYLQENKELGQGYYQSTRDSHTRLVLNVNQVFTVFHIGGSLVEIFKKILNVDDEQLRQTQFNKNAFLSYARELRGLFMHVTHLPFKGRYKIMAFTEYNARNTFFEMQEAQIAIEEYYYRYRNIRLRFPNLPCIITGTRTNQRYWPLELCELIKDQRNLQILKDYISAQMIRSCAVSPSARKVNIERTVSNIVEEGQEYLDSFSITVDTKMIELSGRILQHPSLYAGERITPAPNATWRISKTLQSPKELKTWGVIILEEFSRDAAKDFIVGLIRNLFRLGCRAEKPLFCEECPGQTQPNQIKSTFEYAINRAKNDRRKLQMLVFIISKRQHGVYQNIKIYGDIHFGIVTQCVATENISREISLSYLQNLIYKVNAKLGGVNSTIVDFPLASQNVMIVGIDVTHPSVLDNVKHSIAACIGSYDDTFALYSANIRLQSNPTKEIVDLHVMIRDVLECYYTNKHTYPSKIIFYRDGISESMFDEVIQQEVCPTRAFLEENNIQATITYIVVLKRHHTRFFPKNPRNAGSNGNVRAGLAVSTDVTSPLYFDFYINSHDCFQGTSKPAKYIVLYDDNNFDANTLEKTTHYLTFLFSRCSRAISVPAPCRYADLAAYRARMYLYHLERSKKMSVEELEARIKEAVKVDPALKSILYYV